MEKTLGELTKDLRGLVEDMQSDPLFKAIKGEAGEGFDPAELACVLHEAMEEGGVENDS